MTLGTKAPKYRAKRTMLDGIAFDSGKEAKRYRELCLLAAGGSIAALVLQPCYELQPSFKRNGKTIRAITYRADFQYIENGRTIAEDVKGFKTKDFLLKAKMFQYRYPEIELRLT